MRSARARGSPPTAPCSSTACTPTSPPSPERPPAASPPVPPRPRVWVQTSFVPRSANPRWQQVVQAVGGGPRLLSGGVWLPPENFTPEFTDRRHPPSAIGVLGGAPRGAG